MWFFKNEFKQEIETTVEQSTAETLVPALEQLCKKEKGVSFFNVEMLGKSSLLNDLIQKYSQDHNYFCVYLDLEGR